MKNQSIFLLLLLASLKLFSQELTETEFTFWNKHSLSPHAEVVNNVFFDLPTFLPAINHNPQNNNDWVNDTILEQNWSDNESQWVNNYLSVFMDFDQHGNPRTKLRRIWNTNQNEYLNDFITYIDYDPSGDKIAGEDKKWDTITGEWRSFSNFEYDYEQNGNLTTFSRFRWDTATSHYRHWYQFQYFYDGQNNLTEEWINEWNNTAWIPYLKTLYYYEDGLLTSSIDTWLEGEQWVNGWKWHFRYDENKYLTEKDYFMWHEEDWFRFVQYFYSNNNNGLPLEIFTMSRNQVDTVWNNTKLSNNEYENDYLIRELTKKWNDNALDWNNNKLKTYSYLKNLGINDLNNSVKIIMKNPYSSNSPIKFSGLDMGVYELSLMSVTGVYAFKTSFIQNETVRVNQSLFPGLYFLSISQDDEIIHVEKIIITR